MSLMWSGPASHEESKSLRISTLGCLGENKSLGFKSKYSELDEQNRH